MLYVTCYCRLFILNKKKLIGGLDVISVANNSMSLNSMWYDISGLSLNLTCNFILARLFVPFFFESVNIKRHSFIFLL